jgi:RNA polymerase sigma factor (sigma-70 family)
MPTAATPLLLHVRRLVGAEALDQRPDHELLRRFTRDGDGQAFAALLRRHGAMVRAACRRILQQPHDADDVFQATFLLLARKAASLRGHGSVGSWLYGVARRLALRARSSEARRHARESLAPPRPATDPLAEITLREAQQLFDDALSRLPERCRAALVLCHLEGLTQEEAARQIGCSRSTLKRRLEDGRARLTGLLARRGLTLPAALLAASMAEGAPAVAPEVLADSVLRAATGDPVAERVAALAGRGAGLHFGGKLWAVAVALVVTAAAAGGLAFRPVAHAPGSDRLHDTPKTEEKPAARVDDHGDPLPEGAVRRLGTLRFRHGGGYVNRLLLTPDGKTLVSKSYYGERSICVWELATGKLLHRLPGHYEENRAVALSPDGKTVAVGLDAVIHLHDLATGREVRRLISPVGGTEGLAFTRDGKSLASGHGGREVLLWDVAAGTVQARLPARHNRSTLLAFSPDGKTLATGDTLDQTVRLFDLATRKERHQIKRPSAVHDLAFSPGGSTLALGAQDGVITLWHPGTGKLLRELRSPNTHVRAVAWSPDGKTLATSEAGDYDEKGEGGREYLRFWDPDTGKERRHIKGAWGLVESLSFTADGKTLLSGGRDSVIRRWDVTTGTEQPPADGHQLVVWWLALSPDGKTLAYPDGKLVRLWDVAAGREAGTLPGYHMHGAFSPDGKTLAGGNGLGAINVCDVIGRRLVRRLEIDAKQAGLQGVQVSRVAFAPDGKTLAAAGWDFRANARFNDSSVRLWDPATGKELRRLRFQANDDDYCTPEAVAWSPDGRTLVASGRAEPKAGKLRLWVAATGRELTAISEAINRTLTEPGGPAFPRSNIVEPRVIFSPDGRLLAMNGAMKGLPVWEAATGLERCRLEGHEGATSCVAFSSDGRTLASAGYDGTIRLWDVEEGKELRRLTGHRGKANALAFTPDGKTLLSAGDDTTVLFWDVAAVTRRARPAGGLTGKERDALWADLAGDDAARAHRAIARLSAAPGVFLPILKGRLHPVPVAEGARVAKLLSSLDADAFQAREQASRELREIGEAARSALERERRRPDLSPELRRRLDDLLKRVWAPPVGDRLRELRAVEVLERIGTAEARQVLEALARGSPEARLTREAEGALQRLGKRERRE